MMKGRNRAWSSFVRWFDRSFSNSWIRQIVFILGLLAAFLLMWTLWMAYFHEAPEDGTPKSSFVRTLELMLDPGSFQGSDSGEFPILIQFLITVTGAIFFTAMLITVLGNILNNRIDKIRKGRVNYSFENHVLILGSSSLLKTLLEELSTTKIHGNRKIAVVTDQEIEAVQTNIFSSLPGLDKEIDVTWINGTQNVENVLINAHISKAHSIYILGESQEEDKDSINLETWNLVRKLCTDTTRIIECYLVVERMTSYHVLQFSNTTTERHLHLNIINPWENWAHRVLVTREYQDSKYPAIDRTGISTDDEHTVRFVIYGMSRMGYAMASTAAHLSHFPNFIKDKTRKTKICFAGPGMKQEMDFYLGHYENIFKLAHATYVSWDENNEIKRTVVRKPVPEEDFLDIEWEFWDTTIESEAMRSHLVELSGNEDEYLTIAICDNDSRKNEASALYLPEQIYSRHIPILVYQATSGEVLKSAHAIEKYSCVYPFGMMDEKNDTFLRSRTSKAKRINYLYSLENSGKKFTAMASDEELDMLWHDLTAHVQKLSNMYSANSIVIKLRSMGFDPDNMPEDAAFTDEQKEILSEVEHNRWNMERLLLGIYSVPFAERTQIQRLISSSDPNEVTEGKKRHTELRARFHHKDIGDYYELPEPIKDYDRVIVANILNILK